MPTIEQLEKLLTVDENDSFVLYALAQEHAKQDQHEQAIAYYDRCAIADPKQHYAAFHKATSLVAVGRKPEAIETLRAGLARARDDGDAKAANEIEGYLAELGG